MMYFRAYQKLILVVSYVYSASVYAKLGQFQEVMELFLFLSIGKELFES